MNQHQTPRETTEPDLDIAIIGAGISGIDAAFHLRQNRPGTRFALIESKDDIGGTWHTHRFPGIRSDSDLYTFGFSWKPWTGVPIATADEILAYLNEAIDEQDIRRHIRFNQKVIRAAWSSDTQLWTLEIEQQGRMHSLTCRFLWMCAGYFDHDNGHMPDFPGSDVFEGPIVHPQAWPEDLDHAGKRVVVIGSGATAATLIPAMAETAGHVTMLQRTPTYYFARPRIDEFGETLKALDLPEAQVHDIMRRKYLHESKTFVQAARHFPDAAKQELLEGVRAYLDNDEIIKAHFTPSYRPWHQRVAMVPDGDLFQAIRDGKASVVTDHIDTFTANGIRLKSGDQLAADIIVSATGLTLNALGAVAFTVDGAPFDVAASFTHRGIMFSDLPNVVNVFGYLRSSWTLRADLVSQYVCRLLEHMDDKGAGAVTPRLRAQDQTSTPRPYIDPANFDPGYIRRALHVLPRQGKEAPWIMTQDYFRDREDLPRVDFDDGTLIFTPATVAALSA